MLQLEIHVHFVYYVITTNDNVATILFLCNTIRGFVANDDYYIIILNDTCEKIKLIQYY